MLLSEFMTFLDGDNNYRGEEAFPPRILSPWLESLNSDHMLLPFLHIAGGDNKSTAKAGVNT